MPAKPTTKKNDSSVKEEAKPTQTAMKVQKADKNTEKTAKEEKGVHVMYKTEGNKVTRTHPTCERCGPGYFTADHHDRYTCGHCGFTRYKQK